jgi:amidase
MSLNTGEPSLPRSRAASPHRVPVGFQIVGRYRDELSVLQMASAFEQATRVAYRKPGIA